MPHNRDQESPEDPITEIDIINCLTTPIITKIMCKQYSSIINVSIGKVTDLQQRKQHEPAEMVWATLNVCLLSLWDETVPSSFIPFLFASLNINSGSKVPSMWT